MAEFKKVAQAADIPAGTIKGFQVGYDKIVICNTGEKFYAVIDECTHESQPLNKGKLKGNNLICPHHGARFDVTTGAVTHAPAIVPITTYEVKVENDAIYVKLD